jgi:hypothetical protein
MAARGIAADGALTFLNELLLAQLLTTPLSGF